MPEQAEVLERFGWLVDARDLLFLVDLAEDAAVSVFGAWAAQAGRWSRVAKGGAAF